MQGRLGGLARTTSALAAAACWVAFVSTGAATAQGASASGASRTSSAATASSASNAAIASGASSGGVAPNAYGNLDCNGLSPIQHPIRAALACADPRDPTESDGRFWDNGRYIGHDEPDLNFVSNRPGSGDDVTWTFTLGTDPTASPTDATPGQDVSHYFELSPAVWFSMNLCDPRSYPQTACKPESDANVPGLTGHRAGGGSAFLELQFYPPGWGPWLDGPSFDNTHWGAALTIDSLELSRQQKRANSNCVEPANVAFITRDGVPPGPPSPQLFNLASNTPNADTLLMNPGDTIRVHMFDASAPGGGHAVEAVVEDLTTGQTGFMQASAANGFMNTDQGNCHGYPFNFQPEYNTAAPGNISPWGAGTEVISTAVETGHFTPCTSLSDPTTFTFYPGVTDVSYQTCSGPYEDSVPGGDGPGTVEPTDAYCFPQGDTHGGLAAGFPDTMTGCEDILNGGDLDFDGSSYWPEWPTGTSNAGPYPSTFQFQPPTSGGTLYADYQYQTDLTFQEFNTCTPTTLSGCAAPPPGAPGDFYPYWTLQTSSSAPTCTWEFGNVSTGNTDGGDAQYGSILAPNYPDLVGKFQPVNC